MNCFPDCSESRCTIGRMMRSGAEAGAPCSTSLTGRPVEVSAMHTALADSPRNAEQRSVVIDCLSRRGYFIATPLRIEHEGPKTRNGDDVDIAPPCPQCFWIHELMQNGYEDRIA